MPQEYPPIVICLLNGRPIAIFHIDIGSGLQDAPTGWKLGSPAMTTALFNEAKSCRLLVFASQLYRIRPCHGRSDRALRGNLHCRGCFLWMSNDPIQPLDPSAHNLLFYKRAQFCLIADFARSHPADQERRTPWREQNRCGNRPVGRSPKSAGALANPRNHAKFLNKKRVPVHRGSSSFS
jgi:hypothetical protein